MLWSQRRIQRQTVLSETATEVEFQALRIDPDSDQAETSSMSWATLKELCASRWLQSVEKVRPQPIFEARLEQKNASRESRCHGLARRNRRGIRGPGSGRSCGNDGSPGR